MDIGEIKISLNDNMQEIYDLVENQTVTNITLYDHVGYEGEQKSTISSLDEILQDGQDIYVYGYKSDTGFTFKDVILKAKAKYLRNIGIRKPLQGVYIDTDTGRHSFGVFAFEEHPKMDTMIDCFAIHGYALTEDEARDNLKQLIKARTEQSIKTYQQICQDNIDKAQSNAKTSLEKLWKGTMSQKELLNIIEQTFPNAIIVNPNVLDSLTRLKSDKKPLDKE